MKIRVKELGPVREAVIDLGKKLTVFCGQNATGKTYLAFVVYFITQLENKSLGLPLDRGVIDALLSTNTAVVELDIAAMWAYSQKETEHLKNNLWRFFALAEDKQKQFFGKTSVEIMETEEEFGQRLLATEYDQTIKLNNYIFRLRKVGGERKVRIELGENNIKDDALMMYLRVVLLSRVYALLIYAPITSATIFPVERNSIFTFSNELSIRSNKLKDMIELLSIEKNIEPLEFLLRSNNNRYPKPIKDALSVADDLEQIQKNKSEYFEFAEQIEQMLLKGKLIVSKEGQRVEFKSDMAKTLGLSFHQSSSIVKMLASLIIYLKHIAVRNDLIIIDEPELNLHPSNQILLARIFAGLINSGLRLMISTHSDYIIRELNNLLMLGAGGEDVKAAGAGFGYEESQCLNPNDVAVYFFDYAKSGRKVEVKPVAVGATGFSVKSIDDTIDRQNEISEDLFYTLKYGKIDKDA